MTFIGDKCFHTKAKKISDLEAFFLNLNREIILKTRKLIDCAYTL